jgi:hypothetical protein
MLADRKAEKERLLRQLEAGYVQGPAVVPHPALIRRYEEKVASLREALNDELIRAEASQSLRSLIGSVTVQCRRDWRADARGGGVQLDAHRLCHKHERCGDRI